MKKKLLLGSLMLVMSLGLGLTGCGGQGSDDSGNSGNRNESVPGSDWRTTASFVDATLDHDGEIDVLIEVQEDRLYMYFDDVDQELYQEVYFPYETVDIQASAESLDFYDINNDGYTDFTINVYEEEGAEYCIPFLWDVDGEYFYDVMEEISPEGDFSLTNFIGAWYSEEAEMAIVIDSNYNWQACYGSEIYCTGNITADYGSAILYIDAERYYCTLTYDPGTLTVTDEYGNVYDYDGPVENYIPGGEVIISGYDEDVVGLVDGYYYTDEDTEVYIEIEDEVFFTIYALMVGNEEEVVVDYGYLEAYDDMGGFTAYSTYYDDVTYDVFQFDTEIIIWDNATYELY